MTNEIQTVQPMALEVLTDNATTKYAEYLQACGLIKGSQSYQPTKDDYLRLAQASRLLKLDPQAGEIYFVGGQEGRKVGIVVATAVHVRNAKRAAKRTGDDINITYHMLTPDLNKQHSIADGDTAVEARLTSIQSGQVWYQQAKTVAELVKAGVYTAEYARDLLGGIPYTSAVGIVRAQERFGDESKYSRSERARKRATKAVITISGYKITNYEAVLIAHGMTDTSEDTPAGYEVRMPDHPLLGAGDIPPFMTEGIERVTPHVGTNGHEHNARALGRDDSESLIQSPMPQADAIPPVQRKADDDPLSDTIDALVERAEKAVAWLGDNPGKQLTPSAADWLRDAWQRVYGFASESGMDVHPFVNTPTPLMYAEGIVRVGKQIIDARQVTA